MQSSRCADPAHDDCLALQFYLFEQTTESEAGRLRGRSQSDQQLRHLLPKRSDQFQQHISKIHLRRRRETNLSQIKNIRPLLWSLQLWFNCAFRGRSGRSEKDIINWRSSARQKDTVGHGRCKSEGIVPKWKNLTVLEDWQYNWILTCSYQKSMEFDQTQLPNPIRGCSVEENVQRMDPELNGSAQN